MYVSTVHASENLAIFQRSDDLTNHASRYQRTLTQSKENKGSLNACKCLIMKKIHHDKWVKNQLWKIVKTMVIYCFRPQDDRWRLNC